MHKKRVGQNVTSGFKQIFHITDLFGIRLFEFQNIPTSQVLSSEGGKFVFIKGQIFLEWILKVEMNSVY